MSEDQRRVETATSFVAAAIDSLAASAVTESASPRRRQFAPAFNHWYAPAVRRGYRGSFAAIFDIGLALFEPIARVPRSHGENGVFGWIAENSLLTELVREAAGRGLSTLAISREEQALIEWLLIEPFVRCLEGCWGRRPEAAGREIPSVALQRSEVVVWLGGDSGSEVARVDWTERADRSAKSADASPPPARSPAREDILARLLIARLARYVPSLLHKLDHEVLEACLFGPNRITRDHEIPPLRPVEVSNKRRSVRPGNVGGVVRIDSKLPTDPLIDVIPSEMMLMRHNRTAGLAHLLLGQPLVFRHEREKDEIPQHRALVCFVVPAFPAVPAASFPRWAHAGGAPDYRDTYVYAKRQVFDLIRDLRDAQDAARHAASIEVDAAVFALPPQSLLAVACEKIRLDAVARSNTGDIWVDRLRELGALADLMPGYFVRYLGLAHGAHVPSGSVHADLANFLRHECQTGRYHTVHVILVGMESRPELPALVRRSAEHQPGTHVQLAQIAIDPGGVDADPRLVELGEPAWSFGGAGVGPDTVEVGVTHLEPMSLAAIRTRVVSTVFGEIKASSASQRARIALSQEERPA